jgi:peptidyl-prolyl cis-trans isomerase SurA
VVADKIAGIVGDKIILKSELVNANADIQRQGGQPQDECALLDQMLTQKALVLQAEKDSIPITDEEVEAEIDQQIRYFISQYGSKEALEQISGRSVYQIKDDFRQPFRERFDRFLLMLAQVGEDEPCAFAGERMSDGVSQAPLVGDA